MASYQLSAAVIRGIKRNRQVYKFLLDDLACCDWGSLEQLQQLRSQFADYVQRTEMYFVDSDIPPAANITTMDEIINLSQEAWSVNQNLISKVHACEGQLLFQQSENNLPECLARKIYVDFPELCDVEPLSYQPLTVLCEVIRKHYDLHSDKDFQDAKRILDKYSWSRKEAERRARNSPIDNCLTLVAESTRTSKVPATVLSADVLSLLDEFLALECGTSNSQDEIENKENEGERSPQNTKSWPCEETVLNDHLKVSPANTAEGKEVARDQIADVLRVLEEHMQSRCNVSTNDLVKDTRDEVFEIRDNLKQSCSDDIRLKHKDLMDSIRRRHYEREALNQQTSMAKSDIKLRALMVKKDRGILPCAAAKVSTATSEFKPPQTNPTVAMVQGLSDAGKNLAGEKDLKVRPDSKTSDWLTAKAQKEANDTRLMPPPSTTVVKKAKLQARKGKQNIQKPSEPKKIGVHVLHTSYKESPQGNRKRRFEHSSRQSQGFKDTCCTANEIAIKRQKVIEGLAEKRARISTSLNNEITKDFQKSISSKYFKPEVKSPYKVPLVYEVKAEVKYEKKPAAVSRQTSFAKSADCARKRHKYGKPPILLKIYKDETNSWTSEINLI